VLNQRQFLLFSASKTVLKTLWTFAVCITNIINITNIYVVKVIYKHYKRVWLWSPFCSSFCSQPDETKMCRASKSSNYKIHLIPSWENLFFATKRGEIREGKTGFSLSLSQPSAQAVHTHTLLAWLPSTFTHTFVLLQLRSHSHSLSTDGKKNFLLQKETSGRPQRQGPSLTLFKRRVSAPPLSLKGRRKFRRAFFNFKRRASRARASTLQTTKRLEGRRIFFFNLDGTESSQVGSATAPTRLDTAPAPATMTRVRQSTANGIDTYTGFRQLTGPM
jgi:hypothetical protein